MKLKVDSKWNGMVAIRDKYLKEAKEKGLEISLKGEKMTIPPENLERKLHHISKEGFTDRFSKQTHRLAYFGWSPDKKPEKQNLRVF